MDRRHLLLHRRVGVGVKLNLTRPPHQHVVLPQAFKCGYGFCVECLRPVAGTGTERTAGEDAK